MGADYYGTVDQIRNRLGKNAIMVTSPSARKMTSRVSWIFWRMKAYYYDDEQGKEVEIKEIPDDMKDDVELYRTETIEKICELDDDLMEQYLEDKIPSIDE